LGGPNDAVVGRDPAGCPLWPAGFVGSISHADDQTVVFVARSDAVAAVGVDIERIGRFDASLWPTVFTAAEMFALRALAVPHAIAATVLFSAKESVQKARYAHTGAWTDLPCLRLDLDWPRGQFRHRDVDNGVGAFTSDGGLVQTAYFVDAKPYP
jgi:4'-phosphopantetheinyl transferase EntD